jgi:hypothetical protein
MATSYILRRQTKLEKFETLGGTELESSFLDKITSEGDLDHARIFPGVSGAAAPDTPIVIQFRTDGGADSSFLDIFIT